MWNPRVLLLSATFALLLSACFAPAQQARIDLNEEMLVDEAKVGNPAALIDEQRQIIGPPVGKPESGWDVSGKFAGHFPASIHFDLGSIRPIASLWLFDTHNTGDVVISVGEPDAWEEVATYGCDSYMTWKELTIDRESRYVRITRMVSSANFSEVAIYEHTPAAWREVLARREAEAKAEAQRQAALAKARAEIATRPLVDLGEALGKGILIQEIDTAATPPDTQSPDDASSVRQLLGKDARVLRKTVGEGAHMTWRIGVDQPIAAGHAYVLEVEYPEDAPRTITVLNAANETSRTFHTGATVGDALHPKYVNNINESLDVPLAGEYRHFRMLFRLHDRYRGAESLRGAKGREEGPEDGFLVSIAQFAARNIPLSEGAAVSAIRLYMLPEIESRHAEVQFPPDGLPRRHIFWREEMSDGVITSDKEEERGFRDPLDWYRFKATQMHVLGINTYTKDLLEFGANQHWDSTAYGGHEWVYYGDHHKELWSRILTYMGEQGFSLLPYYEYSGSKGRMGLGNQRRATPLTRDGDYTHIAWRDKYNADLTDPDTYEDFKKILDLTIIRHQEKATFVGAWLRNRGQMPMGFSNATLQRFADETMIGLERTITRQALIDDELLLQEYYDWWFKKRRDFLTAMRDHLRDNGVDDAMMLFTTSPNEPGEAINEGSFLVTDQPELWSDLLAQPLHKVNNRVNQPTPFQAVVREGRYLDALTSFRGTWGQWEWQHVAPPSDPQNYKETDGVLLTHAFNRKYTVANPASLEAFRAPSGLALVRHYSLNENMMYDLHDQNKLGYFVTDVERAGPYCMMAEAIAMANGDPTMLGYLLGNNYARGFPDYVRRFNLAFLSLPALPSERLAGAADNDQVVVRQIATEAHGTWLAVVNAGETAAGKVRLKLPAEGTVTDAATGQPLTANDGALTLDLYPYELRAIHIR